MYQPVRKPLTRAHVMSKHLRLCCFYIILFVLQNFILIRLRLNRIFSELLFVKTIQGTASIRFAALLCSCVLFVCVQFPRFRRMYNLCLKTPLITWRPIPTSSASVYLLLFIAVFVYYVVCTIGYLEI